MGVSLDSSGLVAHHADVASDDLQGLLFALVEQARAAAIRMAGDPDRETTCHFCAGEVPLWESLLVMQLAGVPAHVECPPETLRAKLRQVAPLAQFAYDDFSAAVELRLAGARPTARAGVIEHAR